MVGVDIEGFMAQRKSIDYSRLFSLFIFLFKQLFWIDYFTAVQNNIPLYVVPSTVVCFQRHGYSFSTSKGVNLRGKGIPFPPSPSPRPPSKGEGGGGVAGVN